MSTPPTTPPQGAGAVAEPLRLSVSDELSSRRTGMSFQRTRMSADRTLMSVIRTSLSLISFGFTIFQVFRKLQETQVIKASGSARNLGETLVCIGIGMLVLGIAYHVSFMVELRRQRAEMAQAGLIHAQSRFPVSMTLLVAIVLLVTGITTIVHMIRSTG